jgi:hypothetical protein
LSVILKTYFSLFFKFSSKILVPLARYNSFYYPCALTLNIESEVKKDAKLNKQT